ncbi:hypothetical protein [Candidatus Enterococcus ferrettii]|uniref:Uncharacterized protein n=1 Tax=Candidatus Enterococcus ferrettii TaxID=2815324 RepID=A0ABV0EQ60_9ENTE|nr:hypothetical protein [Enterococcus sp. 665A]MBO1339283.1 hypothetical protein [Enterococcus sp. 665A]
MKKVIVWNWAYVVSISLFLIFLIYWCQFAYTHGYSEEISFWIFFPVLLLLSCLALWGQFTTVQVKNRQLEALSFGNLRRKSFDLQQVTVTFDNKVILPGKSPNMYPIDIRDNQTYKLTRINCGKRRTRAFKIFWESL